MLVLGDRVVLLLWISVVPFECVCCLMDSMVHLGEDACQRVQLIRKTGASKGGIGLG